MLQTKNYTISSTQQKLNLNYAAVGHVTDQKSHRLFKFGLRFHLSLENLTCCDNNTNNTNNMPLTDSNNHLQRHSSNSSNGIMENYEGRRSRHSSENGNNSAIIDTFGRIIVKLAEYFNEVEILHQPENGGSGVSQLRELSWESAGMENQLRERVTQFGNQLSNLRSRIPSKVNELIDNGKDYAKSNPLTFLTIVALVFSCSLPVLIFLAFAIITVAVTFVGFLFVEGTILTVASVVLTSTLLLVGFFTLTITSLLILTYMTINVSYKFVTGSPISETNPIKAILQYLSSSSSPNSHNNGDVFNHTDEASEDEAQNDEVKT